MEALVHVQLQTNTGPKALETQTQTLTDTIKGTWSPQSPPEGPHSAQITGTPREALVGISNLILVAHPLGERAATVYPWRMADIKNAVPPPMPRSKREPERQKAV